MAEESIPRPSWYKRNKPRAQAYAKAYYLAHQESLRAYSRAYTAANRAAMLAKKRAKRQTPEGQAQERAYRQARSAQERARTTRWAREHPERRRAIGRRSTAKRRATQPEKMAADYAVYKAKNPDKFAQYARDGLRKRRARKRGAPRNDLTPQQWQEIQAACDYQCVYCQQVFPPWRLEQDHVQPLSKGGSHTVQNVLPACRPCNKKKGNRLVLCPVQPFLLVA
jgi:5-methylcytosine-specific restriction endonuclease McrA